VRIPARGVIVLGLMLLCLPAAQPRLTHDASSFLAAACTLVPLASDVTCTNSSASVPQQCVPLAYLLDDNCVGMVGNCFGRLFR
jgi:hypothetical protein